MDLELEVSAWVDELAARYEAAGASPAEARRRALIETGGVRHVKEAVRDARIGAALDACLRDARYAWRGLWRSPTFAVVAIATLALGIGATTAIFSVVNALLIAPLPYRDSSQLAFVWSDMTASGYARAPLSGPELFDLRERSTRFTGFGAIWATSGALTGDGDAEQLRLGVVTTDFFPVLGVDAALGRTFIRDDEPQTVPEHIVLSSALWHRRYGADPMIVGRQIRVMGQSMTVVGVMPTDFNLLLPPDAGVPDDLDAFVPFNRTLVHSPRTMQFLRVVGRIRPHVTIAQAQGEISSIASRMSREFTEYGDSGRIFNIVALQRDGVREIRAPLLALFGGVGILLVIACLNVTNLLMARAASRKKETAVRVALGASRVHLLRQSVVEGLVLSALGGVAGLLVARWSLNALIALRPDSLSRIISARVDPVVLLFAAGTSLTWGLLFSLAPVTVRARTGLAATLQRDGRKTFGTMDYRARAALVVTQIALGVTLLIGAELMVRAFIALQRVDPGFRADSALSFRLPIGGTRYRTPEAINNFARTLQANLLALPGVTSVGAVTHLPLDHVGNWSGPYSSRAGSAKSVSPLADYRAISPGYFETVGAHLVDGRLFTEADDPKGEQVAIVDERLARDLWPNQPAVGQQLAVDPDSTGHTNRMVTVVGVVRHLRLHTLLEEVREQLYLPWRQVQWSPIAFVVRVSGDPAALAPAVRQAVGQLDPLLPVYDLRPMADYTVKARATQRFTMILGVTFAAVALALACVGVYGVMAYSVAQRRHEFGVRLALGAQPAQLIQLVLNEGMKLTAGGLALGVVGGLGGARLLQSLLFGVSPHDVASYAIAVIVLGACAAAACLIPAWRATGNSAVQALRTE
jgi:putative ABC transport system permease protein